MLVVSYLAGIPSKNKNPEKPAVLKNFINGVNLHNQDRGLVTSTNQIIDCDVAVLQGFVHERSQNVPHLLLRKNVLEYQKNKGKSTIIIDSNLFLYKDPHNTKKYLRYSYNGVFPTTGEYCNSMVDGIQWEKIKSDLKVSLQPWKDNRGYILICAQRDGGWSMAGKRVVQWVRETVEEIRKYSSKPIKVRMHPGDSNSERHARALRVLKRFNVDIIDYKRTTLLQNLQEACAVVVYNSSPAVAAAIEGVPVFVTDPIPQRSQAFRVAHTDLKFINDPQEFDREMWINQIAQMHWNQKDLLDGRTWNWMRRWA